MNLFTTKKLMGAIGLIWLGVMFYLWFPELFPGQAMKMKSYSVPDKGIHRAEAFQMVRYNVSTLQDLVHVCITSSEQTMGGMIALINSIDEHSKHPVMYHLVVEEGTTKHGETWIMESSLHDIMYELIEFPSEWVRGKIKVRGGREELASPMNYARYYLPRLLPDLGGRIVFIDDDCIVQGDIKELADAKMKPDQWAVFSEDCVGSAKRLTFMKNIYSDYIDFRNKHVLALDLNPKACSFNAGVYVTDLDIWRKNNITEKLEYWMKLNTEEEVYGSEKGGGGSQPPMMLVFYKKYAEMDPSWHIKNLGVKATGSYTKSYLSHAKLLHWNGHFKPWHRVAQHSDIWDKYYIKDPTGQFEPIRREQ